MSFEPGDRVFAKIKGFSSWPARINPLPPDVSVPKGKVPVFFYGTYQVSFVPVKNVVPYKEFKEKWGKPKANAQFMTALEEIESNPKMLMLGEDPEAESFLSQFYDFKRSEAMSAKRRRVAKTTTVKRESPVISMSSTKSDITTETSDAVSTGGSRWEDHNDEVTESEQMDAFSELEEEEEEDDDDGEGDELLPSPRLADGKAVESVGGTGRAAASCTDREARRAARKLAKKAEKKAMKKAMKREAKRMQKESKRAERRARREAKRERRRTSRQEVEPLELDGEEELLEHPVTVEDDELAGFSEAETELAADPGAQELLEQPGEPIAEVQFSKRQPVDLDSQTCPRSTLQQSEPEGWANESPSLTASPAQMGQVDSSDTPPKEEVSAGFDSSHSDQLQTTSPARVRPLGHTGVRERLAEVTTRSPTEPSPGHRPDEKLARRRAPTQPEVREAVASTKPTERTPAPEEKKRSRSSTVAQAPKRRSVADHLTAEQPQANCDPVNCLKHICHELKGCLVRGHERFQVAVKFLNDLRALQVRLPELAQARELMDCVKKCRRYKLSSDVREAAEKVLQHFQTIRSLATKEELAEAHMLLTTTMTPNHSAGPTKLPTPPTTASTNQLQPTVTPEKASSPVVAPANSEPENLAADLEARVDDVLSRIRATEERMAASARANSNSLQKPPASAQPSAVSAVATVGHTIRASAVAAAAAHMHDEEDEEEVMLRVEQVAAFQAASKGAVTIATTNLEPVAKSESPRCPSVSPSVDLDLDSRIEKLRTSSTTDSVRRHSKPTASRPALAQGSRTRLPVVTSSGTPANSTAASFPKLPPRLDRAPPAQTGEFAAAPPSATPTLPTAIVQKDDELYDLLGV